MSTNTPQKLQDELVAALAPDMDPTSIALVTAWFNNIRNGGILARGVGTANHSLTAFTVGTNTDGITFVQGDVVLLVAQTTATENGLYVVGAVATTAPLTRLPLLPTGYPLPSGLMVKVGGEGTVYKNTEWKSFAAAATAVVGTTDPKFYPTEVSWTCALVAGVMTCGLGATTGAPATLPIFSAKSYVTTVKSVTGGTIAVNGYNQLVAATPGIAGVGTATVTACIAAGTIQASDTSTCFFTLINQA